jgi:uncharacterized protein
MRRSFALLGLLAALLALGCERGDPPTVMTTPNGSRLELPAGVAPIDFATGTVTIEADGQTHTLRVEIAETAEQRERGLMFRTSMPEDAGMIFIYPVDTPGGFWMFNTYIPLSIAFVRMEGVIFQILEMEPCRSEFASMCPSYPARMPFRYAIEANQGWFERRGIQPGAEVVFRRD